MSYFRMVNSTLSSALSSFTSEFGMGSGGSYSLLSPGKSVLGASRWTVTEEIGKVEKVVHLHHDQTLERYMVKPHGQLVLVSFTHY